MHRLQRIRSPQFVTDRFPLAIAKNARMRPAIRRILILPTKRNTLSIRFPALCSPDHTLFQVN